MAISFNEISVNIRTPGQYVEFDNSIALTGLQDINERMLILGQRLATGEVAANKLVMITSADDAAAKFGRGSQIHRMCAAAKGANAYTEMWAVASDDDEAAVAATGTITLGGSPTASGTLYLYIGGERTKLLVEAESELSDIAAALVTAVNADKDLPVTASATDAAVTLRARNGGICGNDIDLRINYYQGEALPAGLTVTFAAMSGGTSNPDVGDAIAALADEQFKYWAFPWTDAPNLNEIDEELEDRWGPMRQIEAFGFSAMRGTLSETGTFGNSRNGKLISITGTNLAPTEPCVWAATTCAVAAYYLNIDPARPLQTLEVRGLLPPAFDKRWSIEERNILLHDGISTTMVDSSGKVLIERVITTYQNNAYGVPDASYLDLNTLAILAYIRAQVRARISSRYGRHKLAADGTPIKSGQAIATPGTIRAELVGLAKAMQDAGIIEDVEQFKADLVVEINETYPDRVDVRMSPNLINQLRVFAGQVQFIL
jgi:phage tail sheath gpL-like